MFSRLSSIFSFDTLQRPTSAPKGCLLALALLLSFELGIARRDWFWHQIPHSHGGVVDAIEKQVIDPAPEPKVILLGNSRLRDAVSPRLLEKEMGLPEGAVLNLALTSGTPFDSLTMYTRNRANLSRADVLLVDFELDYFVHGPCLPNDRIQRFATLKERFEMFRGTSDLLPAVAGYGWRAYGVKRSLHGWRKNRFQRQADAPIGEDGRIEWRRPKKPAGGNGGQDSRPAVTEDVERLDTQLADFGSLRTEHRDHLLRLIDLAREDGVRVVLVHVPLRDSVVDCARKNHPASYDVLRDALSSLADEADAFFFFESARDVSLPDTEFLDYGHLTKNGASAVTRRLGQRLRSEFRAR